MDKMKIPNFGAVTGVGSSGNDSKYFQTTKKGEIHELKEELANPKPDKKKDAVKKVIAAMTVGKDVSMLFTDVVNCIQTSSIELKKLVYLYLINYAKSQPDLAILAVNTFVKDSQDSNPLVRALAVRTMGCIRVDRITEYLCEPLRKCLKDEDPYVRKTAAVCVAKLYDINGELVEDQGFLEMVHDLLGDSNPMVVSNAVAALSEISESSSKGASIFRITSGTLQKLLAALNECTEWGQVFILDSLANYMPQDAREAESIVERVTPRLQHANSAVVLSAVKVMMRYMDKIDNQESLKTLYKKMAPPLVTLLSAEPEIQYVALRNINLIVQRRPQILAHEVKVFFCKYNDPIYVKMEKLDIMVKLASERNIDQELMELKEYATEVDIEFVRRAVRCIGRCAIKLDKAAERCINTLLELIQTKVNYVVQEAVIVIKDIFRKYPNRYESIIGTLCENLDTLDEPEAKASMVWIIGEYAERIDNADELLETFLESFVDEPPMVQLQLLTATVKLFLKRPTNSQQMVKDVLNLATQESDDPDLRDRGYIYWRLLSTDPEAAKQVVLAEKPTITDDISTLEPRVLDELIANLSTLASIYHKPPTAFQAKGRAPVQSYRDASQDILVGDEDGAPVRSDDQGAAVASGGGSSGNVMDLLGDLMGGGPSAPAPSGGGGGGSGGMMDLLGGGMDMGVGGGGGASSGGLATPKRLTLPKERGDGLQISSRFISLGNGSVTCEFTIENLTNMTGANTPMSGFAVQLNKNSFGFAPDSPNALGASMPPQLMPGQSHVASFTLQPSGTVQDMRSTIQIAVKNNIKVFYFQDQMHMKCILSPNGRMERNQFLEQWKGIPNDREVSHLFQGLSNEQPQHIQSVLEQANMFFVANRSADNKAYVYCSMCTFNGEWYLVEVATAVGTGQCKVSVRSSGSGQYNTAICDSVEQTLKGSA